MDIRALGLILRPRQRCQHESDKQGFELVTIFRHEKIRDSLKEEDGYRGQKAFDFILVEGIMSYLRQWSTTPIRRKWVQQQKWSSAL